LVRNNRVSALSQSCCYQIIRCLCPRPSCVNICSTCCGLYFAMCCHTINWAKRFGDNICCSSSHTTCSYQTEHRFSFRLRTPIVITMSSRTILEDQASPYQFFKRDVSTYVSRRILKQQTTPQHRATCLRKMKEVMNNKQVHFSTRCEKFAAVVWEIPAMQREDKVSAIFMPEARRFIEGCHQILGCS
jgi:hypothetical protein